MVCKTDWWLSCRRMCADFPLAAAHHHQPPNAQPRLQPTASPQPTAPCRFSLRGHELPYVQPFRYLGSYFSGDCRLDKEISWRLTAAGAAVQRPAKLWRSSDISSRTKTRINCSLVLSVMLYGAESWPITPSQLQWLAVFHRRCLRSILGVRRRDGISIEELLRRTQLCNIGTTIRRLLLRWLGLESVWHDKSCLDSLEAKGQLAHRQ